MSTENILEPSKEEKSATSSYYNSAMRWIEDTYLAWFGENRTSYGVKGTPFPKISLGISADLVNF
jgi:hypothetical protein